MHDWTATRDAREYIVNLVCVFGLMITTFSVVVVCHWLMGWWQAQSRKVDGLMEQEEHPVPPIIHRHTYEGVPEDFADVWQTLERAAILHAQPHQRYWQQVHGNPGYFTRCEVLLLCQLEERYHQGDFHPNEDGGRVA